MPTTAYRHRVIVSLEFTVDPERVNADRLFTAESVESLADSVAADLRDNYEALLGRYGAPLYVDAVASITRETDDDDEPYTILSDGSTIGEEG